MENIHVITATKELGVLHAEFHTCPVCDCGMFDYVNGEIREHADGNDSYTVFVSCRECGQMSFVDGYATCYCPAYSYSPYRAGEFWASVENWP